VYAARGERDVVAAIGASIDLSVLIDRSDCDHAGVRRWKCRRRSRPAVPCRSHDGYVVPECAFDDVREYDVVRAFDADVDHADALLDQPSDRARDCGSRCDQAIVGIDAEHIGDRQSCTAARRDFGDERSVCARRVAAVRKALGLYDRMRERGPGGIGAGVDDTDVAEIHESKWPWLGDLVQLDFVLPGRTEEMVRRNAREGRERLQLRNGLLNRASPLHANARERFVERSERPLGDDRKSRVANGVDGSAVSDHQHFATHALVTGSVALHFKARRRAAAAVVAAMSIVVAASIVGAGAIAAGARVVRFH